MKVLAVLASLTAVASAFVYVAQPEEGGTLYAGQNNTIIVSETTPTSSMGLVIGIRPNPDTTLKYLYKGRWNPVVPSDGGDASETFSLLIPADFEKGDSAQIWLLRTSTEEDDSEFWQPVTVA